VRSWDGDLKEVVRDIFADFVEQELFIESGGGRLQYLGLEGPNFRSYREILNKARECGISLPGLFVEQENRTANVMSSFIRAYPDEFRGAFMLRGDVDNAVMLDFAKERRLNLHRRDKEVVYCGERMSLDDYSSLLNRVDKGDSTWKLSERYGVSREFVQAATNRFVGNFDVVFLDYMGEMNDERAEVLGTFAERRLNDKAVVAVTYNVAPRILGRRNNVLTSEQMEEAFRGHTINMFSKLGYRVVNDLSERYKDSTDEMCFQAYSVRRKNE
jgi:hypothetical protein